MNLKELQKKISEVLGVSESEKELAYDVLISKIVEIVTEGLTLKIPRVGYFQLKRNKEREEYSLIFSAIHNDLHKKTDELYIVIDVTGMIKDSNSSEENVFSIGVAKPLIPLDKLSDTDSDTSYTILRKSIEERVAEILAESDQMPYYNMWDEYNNVIDKENITEIENSKTKLEELTADIDFKEDLIAEDITHNLLNMDLNESDINPEVVPPEPFPELSPTELLSDYLSEDYLIDKNYENNKIDAHNHDEEPESFTETIDIQTNEKTPENDDEIVFEEFIESIDSIEEEPVEKENNIDIVNEQETLTVDDLNADITNEQNELIINKRDEEIVEDESSNSLKEIEVEEKGNQLLLNDDQSKVQENEIEIELGKKYLLNEIYDSIDELPEETDEKIVQENTLTNQEEIVLNRKELIDQTEFLDVEVEEEDYLGLKKRSEEKIEWNWGDELKEEFGSTNEVESSSFDFMHYDDDEEKDTLSDILKKNKTSNTSMFEELDKSIKKEVEETDREIEYMEYSAPPPQYEFVEERHDNDSITSQVYQPTSVTDSFYENEIINEYTNNKMSRYFNKTFIAIFSSFVVIIAIVIYILIPSKNKNEDLDSMASTNEPASQNQIEQNVIPPDTQTSIDILEEDDFPRVASVPIKDSPTGTTVTPVTPPVRQQQDNNLYRNISNDQRVNKTIFYDGSEYNVQVSSWRNREKAEQEVRRLKNKGYNSFILIANLPEKGGTWYRVRIGSLKSQREAEELITKNDF